MVVGIPSMGCGAGDAISSPRVTAPSYVSATIQKTGVVSRSTSAMSLPTKNELLVFLGCLLTSQNFQAGLGKYDGFLFGVSLYWRDKFDSFFYPVYSSF